MERISIFFMLVGVWMGATEGRFVVDETEFRIEDDDKTALHGDGLIGDSDVDLDNAVLEAILRGDISLEELLGEGIVQGLETKIMDGSLTDSRWLRCLEINRNILGIHVNTQDSLPAPRSESSFPRIFAIAVSNPPSLCYGIPGIKLLKVCVQFYNINIANKSGCVRLKISAALTSCIWARKKALHNIPILVSLLPSRRLSKSIAVSCYSKNKERHKCRKSETLRISGKIIQPQVLNTAFDVNISC